MNKQTFSPLAYMVLKCAEIEAECNAWQAKAQELQAKIDALTKPEEE